MFQFCIRHFAIMDFCLKWSSVSINLFIVKLFIAITSTITVGSSDKLEDPPSQEWAPWTRCPVPHSHPQPPWWTPQHELYNTWGHRFPWVKRLRPAWQKMAAYVPDVSHLECMLRTSLLGCCSPQWGHGRGLASPTLWELSSYVWGTPYSTAPPSWAIFFGMHAKMHDI